MKLLKFLQYAYLVFFALFFYDTISNWNVDRGRAYMSLFFAVLAMFMYFFRKKFRKRFEERGKL
ncbi:MAG: hypothetical protein HKN00_04910 [Flavobacteriaceae bacterium]|nr:hypothetical protein [Bacteroidia bacterium]NNF74503.1 hypothetical protein [Flavobacteriaceae bacterium]NNK74338.1 hypothetical protein [Flavobacteriaceae bacterium]